MSSVLSALLLGLFPVAADLPKDVTAPLQEMRIAPPAENLVIHKRLSASGILVMDLGTGQTLYDSQGDIERPMASLTKLMTALIIVEHHKLDEWVPIPKIVTETQGSVAYLPEGEKFTVGDLLSAMMIASANDAAVALANYHSGSTEAFVKEMNARAASLGLTGTRYANSSGLDDPRQWSTPRDIAILTSFVLKVPAIRERMGERGSVIVSRGGQEIKLAHTHALLRAGAPGVTAGKTGTTGAAGQCLVSVIEKEGRQYVVVLLHSRQRYVDMKTVLANLLGGESVPSTLPVEDTECAQGGGCPIK
ncbi:MAG: serine hydrolase [Candidatus Peribacteraceae bacterium]|nr:serine hydrolase [Candidatus Peribacteraceae bacterium]MDD5074806.1 serine hydrolase [Candidatus Peribacteraceae bacterium]